METEKLYYTIAEVAKILGENQSLVRFWSDKFPTLIKPTRNNKGNRLYSAKDVDNFKHIHYFVKELGMTLEGAERRMKGNRAGDDIRPEVVNKLGKIREQLKEILNDKQNDDPEDDSNNSQGDS